MRAEKIKKGEVLSTVFDNSPEGLAIHEYGHAISNGLTRGIAYDDPVSVEYWNWYKSLSKEDIRNGISSYAATNRGEFEAECFCDLQTNSPRPLPKKFGEFLEKSKYTGYTGNSNADAAEHLSLKKDVFGCKPIKLSPKEYAHVISELETWMKPEDRESVIVSKLVGNYSYTFVFDGVSYKCIKKAKIVKG